MKVIKKELAIDSNTFQPVVRLELEFQLEAIQETDNYNKGIRDDLVKVLGEELIRAILEK